MDDWADSKTFSIMIEIPKVVVILCVFMNGVQTSTRQDIQDLHDKLLPTYNKDLGPNFNLSQPIVLYITFNLFTLNEFDDKAGKLVFLGVSTIQWQDDRMVWDPLLHGNTTTLRLPQSKVWIPNLLVANSYDNVKEIGYDIVQVTYTSDGWASWPVSDLFDVSCTADIAYYPQDRQRCEIYIIPWAYVKGTFDLRLPLDTMIQNDFIDNGMWNVLSTEMKVQEHIDNNYVVMVIKFQRRPLFVILNLLLPITVVGLLNVFIFLLPPEPGERTAFGITVLLAMAVFLSIVSDQLPSTSHPHIARVSIYIAIEVALSAIIMVFAIVSILLYNTKDDKPVPGWIKRLVPSRSKSQKHTKHGSPVHSNVDNADVVCNDTGQSCAGADYAEQFRLEDNEVRCIPNYRGRPHTVSEDLNERPTTDTYSVSWIDVAKLFDKVCLILFLSLNICIIAAKVIDTIIIENSEIS
ncbi:acetylcholine receptor subunit beta-like [Ylistrum balloti]|uniref:acetylcholine receptor subunit beta-like n=1 Tax=Ylistrum balloti TaxID=509963 RepID=UPI00290584B6|nr:acetylcholine receptor subunit beta-like [Ylistrum balloti]